MNHGVIAAIVFAQFMNLGMAVVAGGYAVGGAGCLNLLVFQTAILQTGLVETGLKKAAATAAAVVVGPVGHHVDEIFFTNHGFDDKPQIFCNGIPVAFPDNLTRVLNRKFDFEILVPIGIDLEFAFPNPFGVIFINIFDDKVVGNVEFSQSCQD
jgi:hypothetical protein